MTVLQGLQPRARWMRLGTAEILKRFYFCERSLVIACSAWLPLIAAMEPKTLLTLFSWQNAQTANELRERTFELRYPSRSMDEEGADRSLVELFDELRNSPSEAAFFSVLATVLLPAVRDAYREFLHHSDPLADAPTHRFLNLALTEKHQQIETVRAWADQELARRPADRARAEAWTAAFLERLSALGGVGTERVPVDLRHQPLPGGRVYAVPIEPARDQHYHLTRFYWPDNVDPTYPYGEGYRLQLALGHQSLERGLGSRDGRHYSQLLRLSVAVGICPRCGTLDLRRVAALQNGTRPAHRLGLQAGGIASRQLHLSRLCGRGPHLPPGHALFL